MPGVYISYPFCAQKCTYCNFASGVFPRELEPKIRGRAGFRNSPASLAVAAGDGLSRRRNAQRHGDGRSGSDPEPRFQGERQWREATIEVAPGRITRSAQRRGLAAGINRVSLGVQSFVQRELARTGRKHTAEIVEREIALLRGAGSRISISI